MTQPTTNLQVSPYLKTQWQFPYDDLRDLSHQIDIAYIDIASKVNNRIVGLFATGFPMVNGERWYVGGSNTPQQALRQVYTFTGAGSIPHGIDFASLSLVTSKSYGSYTDGTNWYGVIYASSVAIAGQATFYVTPTNIVITLGAGVPAITSGIIVLEWLSQF